MELLAWIILFSLLGGGLSVLMAGTVLLFPEKTRTALISPMVSFAIGALLGGAFLALIPHAMTAPGVTDVHEISLTILIGLLVFFLLEKLVLWRHCHIEHCETHGIEHVHEQDQSHHHKASGTLILIGDALHNFVDGILIAAAFLTDFNLGIITSLAIAAHEVPQELGDFAILLQSGMRRGKALQLNLLSSVTSVFGAVLAYFALSDAQQFVPYVIAVAAASFIYIAVADLIPGLHKDLKPGESVRQFVLIGAGISLIYFSHQLVH